MQLLLHQNHTSLSHAKDPLLPGQHSRHQSFWCSMAAVAAAVVVVAVIVVVVVVVVVVVANAAAVNT